MRVLAFVPAIASLIFAAGCAPKVLVDVSKFDKVVGSQSLAKYDSKKNIDEKFLALKTREDVVRTFGPPSGKVPLKNASENNLQPVCDLWKMVAAISLPSKVLNDNRNGGGSEISQLVVCYKDNDLVASHSWDHTYGISNSSGGQVVINERDLLNMPSAFAVYQPAINYITSRKHQLVLSQ